MSYPTLTDEEVTEIKSELQRLHLEHRDLDLAISQLGDTVVQDELLIRRLKKRKLNLKDRLIALEKLLVPDIPA
ncbi:MAG: DUF465 domain-containing protein [Azonexus sp.]|jgi:hypothetical protein|nr:DUF465 domain-containing protein [Azonexus sp.]